MPLTELFEIVGKISGVDPKQYGPKLSKLATVPLLTTTEIETGAEHCPAFGVNVKLNVPALFVFIAAGNQLPVTPFV
jgi:hypothetical protein